MDGIRCPTVNAPRRMSSTIELTIWRYLGIRDSLSTLISSSSSSGRLISGLWLWLKGELKLFSGDEQSIAQKIREVRARRRSPEWRGGKRGGTLCMHPSQK